MFHQFQGSLQEHQQLQWRHNQYQLAQNSLSLFIQVRDIRSVKTFLAIGRILSPNNGMFAANGHFKISIKCMVVSNLKVF
jgi:hypothetical protein